jgi:hypothetical protein
LRLGRGDIATSGTGGGQRFLGGADGLTRHLEAEGGIELRQRVGGHLQYVEGIALRVGRSLETGGGDRDPGQ